MSGLDNLFNATRVPYGALGGYQSGVADAVRDNKTLADTIQQRAATDRYTQETPYAVTQASNQAEKGRLDNLQGQSDEQAGVYGANSQNNMAQAQLKAAQAKAAFEQLPIETQTKFHQMVTQKNAAMLDDLEQAITQTGSTKSAISVIESDYPDVTKDSGWAAAKQQYLQLSPDQVLQEIRKKKAAIASSNAYGSPKVQGEMNIHAMDNATHENVANIMANGRIGAAEARGTSGAAGHETNSEAIRRLAAVISSDAPEEAKQAAEYELSVRAKALTTATGSNLDPALGGSKSIGLPPRPGGRAPAAAAVDPTFQRWMTAAKAKNPNASTEELTRYYQNKYGK